MQRLIDPRCVLIVLEVCRNRCLRLEESSEEEDGRDGIIERVSVNAKDWMVGETKEGSRFEEQLSRAMF